MRDPLQDAIQNEGVSQYEEQVLSVDRVARVVKGGRRFRFRALVAVGDKKGTVGVGVAKGSDVQTAISKASQQAHKQLIKIDINSKGSIHHEVTMRQAGAKVFLKPASAGTGLIAGGVVRTILELAGITSILSKSLGSSNKVNVAYATIEALQAIVPKSEWLGAKK